MNTYELEIIWNSDRCLTGKQWNDVGRLINEIQAITGASIRVSGFLIDGSDDGAFAAMRYNYGGDSVQWRHKGEME